jgi:hypothetical protein
MYSLSEAEFEIKAAPALRKVFVHEDPYDRPFASSVEARALLYPVSLTLGSTEVPLLEAIVLAATKLGDLGFYLSIIERPTPQAQNELYHWHFSFTDMDAYLSLDYPSILEHTLYSPSGRWGLMISHEDHALLGGTWTFFKTMKKIIPGFDDIRQVHGFLAYWEYWWKRCEADISWIPGLLTHVYDAKTARQLLTEADLSSLL